VRADDWSSDQRAILDAIASLGAATRPEGGGADAYAAVLTDDYSRWTVGSSVINDRQTWVEGLRKWFDDGWRVVDSESEYLEITVHGPFATVRRIVEEQYRGPAGERTDSKAALAETWIDEEGSWKLLRVHVLPLEQD
jgi:ketosteroid isomerase-like protein